MTIEEKLLALELILKDVRGYWAYDLENRINTAEKISLDLLMNEKYNKDMECMLKSIREFKETIDAFKIKNIHITSIVGDIWNTPEYMLSANANRQGIIFRQLI